MKFTSTHLKIAHKKFVDLFLDQLNNIRKVSARVRGKKIIYSKFSRINNFGDKFNFDLVRFFGAELIYVASPQKSQMALTGSILGDYPREFAGYILGSGFISERYNRMGNNWKVKFIRGPLSAKQCGALEGTVYGDPGILASQIYSFQRTEKYKLGVVPHKRDINFVKKMEWGKDVKIINPRQLPKNVAREIKECRFIASSSLHGLIFADSFRIPNVHLKISNNLVGGLHKFKDYYFGMEAKPEFINYTTSISVEDIIKICRLRYSDEYLTRRQEEINRIIENVMSEQKISI